MRVAWARSKMYFTASATRARNSPPPAVLYFTTIRSAPGATPLWRPLALPSPAPLLATVLPCTEPLKLLRSCPASICALLHSLP